VKTTVDPILSYELYKQKNSYALLLILKNVDAVQFEHIADTDSSFEAWSILRRVHKGIGGAHLMSLFRSFFSYRNSGDSVDVVATTLSRLQVEISNISPKNKPTDDMKTFRLMEIFMDTDDLKGTIEVLM